MIPTSRPSIEGTIAMTKLHDLHDSGQSVWLDFIRRDMLESGELAGLVADGVRGLTSNPTIFQQAISTSTAYDEQIADVIQHSPAAGTGAVFEELAVADIRGAADALQGVYQKSDGADGFVSLEVSPHLAHDTDGTVADARRLWDWVDRPNLMIKVPGTPAGIPAQEELLAAGMNINSTLMFSLADYEAVAHAHLRGLSRADDPRRIASVASFFVSRVDSKTDAALEKIGSREAMDLRGKIAVANAKLAYRRFQELYRGEAFAQLASAGARPQRVLWASTSTKNPEYRDVLYVEDLIGPDTVNTMPPATIEAFSDHGIIDANALTGGVDDAADQIAALDRLGIDFDEITAELQREGVVAFADSFDDLLSALEVKIGELRR
jgi:transaldolase